MVHTSKTKAQLRQEVTSKFKTSTFNSFKKYYTEHTPSLWAETKPRNFEKYMLYLTLFKDLENVGFNRLKNSVSDWLKLSNESISHNVQAVRGVLKEWAKTQIVEGTQQDWKMAGINTNLEDCISDTNLILDFTDFKLQAKERMSKKSSKFSAKKNCYASRFQVWIDLKRRIRKFDGPFDAKMFDEDYLKTQKTWIKNKLDGIGYAAPPLLCWKKI
jgi:hypothetical protein